MHRRSPESGRWHRGDKPILYASLDPALAVLEALAHLKQPLKAHVLLRLRLRGVSIKTLRLPDGWRSTKRLTRDAGEAWLADRLSQVLQVPSALCTESLNVLIATDLLDAGQLSVTRLRAFRFDARLLAGLKPRNWQEH
jgi:RES domain-containing protein